MVNYVEPSRREQGSRIVEAGVPRSETRSRLPVCTGDRNMLAGRFPAGGQPSPNAARPTRRSSHRLSLRHVFVRWALNQRAVTIAMAKLYSLPARAGEI